MTTETQASLYKGWTPFVVTLLVYIGDIFPDNVQGWVVLIVGCISGSYTLLKIMMEFGFVPPKILTSQGLKSLFKKPHRFKRKRKSKVEDE